MNRDVLGVYGDVAAGGEFLDDAAYHLARGADSRGDVVLREALANHASAALLDRVFVDKSGEPSVDILQGEVKNLAGEAAHLADQLVDQIAREFPIPLEQALDVSARDHEEAA